MKILPPLLFCTISLAITQANGVEMKKEAAMDARINHQIQDRSGLNDCSVEKLQKLANIINSVAKVIEKQSTPEKEYSTLGELEYVFPKDPKKSITIVFFSPKNFRGAGSFDRISPNSDWYKGGYAFGGRQRPYRLGLTKNFFSDELGLILEKASFERGRNSPISENNVYYFHSKNGNKNIQFVFETRVDASNLQDGYPKSFHQVDVIDTVVQKSLEPKPPAPLPITRKSGEPCPQTGFWKASSTDTKYWNIEGLQRTAPMFVKLGEPMPRMTTSWDKAPEQKERSIVWTWVKSGN
jgi:hypothetical protein